MARLLKVSFEMETSPGGSNLVFPQVPHVIKTLRSGVKDCYCDAVLLTCGMLGGLSGYDELGSSVIVPSVCMVLKIKASLCGGTELVVSPRIFHWVHTAGMRRGMRLPIRAPRLLKASLDASWMRGTQTKRSREYLNSEMDKFDLDNVYYGHAYETDA